jgi:hypothetical protein
MVGMAELLKAGQQADKAPATLGRHLHDHDPLEPLDFDLRPP